MTKKQWLVKRIEAKGGKAFKSWTIKKLESTLEDCKDTLSWTLIEDEVDPSGNWNVARDWFPTIEVYQDSKHISVTTFDSSGFQDKATVETEWINFDRSEDGSQVFVRGSVFVKNWINRKCSGSQKFCFAIFVGDSGHIYTHRAPATKGWMTCKPDLIRKRLRKLGIGAVNVIQQGDFLLKPANGNAHDDSDFAHERMGSGHHNFEFPVLYHRGQYWITEPTTLIHTAVDGIQHPDIVVPPGKWVIGTTANQLAHGNARD
jgi:hypothetical protein